MNITKKHRRYLFIYVVNVLKNLVGEDEFLQLTTLNFTSHFIYLLLQVPTIFFTSVYYEKKELLEDPVNDSGRRELHVRFTTKEYPLIMRAMREMRSKNPAIFKDIPEDDTELKAAKQYVPEDETDEDEMCEEEEEEYEYEEGEDEEEAYEDVE